MTPRMNLSLSSKNKSFFYYKNTRSRFLTGSLDMWLRNTLTRTKNLESLVRYYETTPIPKPTQTKQRETSRQQHQQTSESSPMLTESKGEDAKVRKKPRKRKSKAVVADGGTQACEVARNPLRTKISAAAYLQSCGTKGLWQKLDGAASRYYSLVTRAPLLAVRSTTNLQRDVFGGTNWRSEGGPRGRAVFRRRRLRDFNPQNLANTAWAYVTEANEDAPLGARMPVAGGQSTSNATTCQGH